MKPMTASTLAALRRLYQLLNPRDIDGATASALVRRGLIVRALRVGEGRGAAEELRLTQDGLQICRALFGPTKNADREAHMNAANESSLYYVVLWNFQLDDSGKTVRDGVVFSDIEAAKNEAGAKLVEELNYAFASRLRPTWSVRFSGRGYVVGDIVVKAIAAAGQFEALQEALVGKGEEVHD